MRSTIPGKEEPYKHFPNALSFRRSYYKMAGTRKNRSVSSRNTTRSLPRYANTIHGLNHWHKAVFEKLGWMVLAKAKGYTDKVRVYKDSIGHLAKSIEHVMGEYESANRKHDLNVLHMNVMCLHDFVMKHL